MKTALDITQYRDQISALTEENAQLKSQLAWLKRHVFGRKSEKQIIENPDQGSLFNVDDTQAAKDTPTKEIKAHKRSSKKQTNDDDVNGRGLRFTDDVPQRIIDVPSPELAGKDADLYDVIGTKETCRLAQQPGSYVVLIYRHKVLALKSNKPANKPANKSFKKKLISTPAPANVLEGCYADVSLIAGLMVDKAVYHLPLHRQHQRMLDSGVTVSRATLLKWMQKGIELLRPIARAQWQHILSGGHLAMDEVPMKAGRIETTSRTASKMKQTYFWPIYGEDDEVAFTWSAGRGMAHAIEQLNGFTGTLLTDGYPAYNSVVKKLNEQASNVVHAGCWAHCRRMFENALEDAANDAQYALDIIAKLYQVETRIRENDMGYPDIQRMRSAYSTPIVEDFFTWLFEQRQRPEILPKSKMGKALYYAHNQQTKLKIYLTQPDVPIDTNHLERALRVVPLGRNNFKFCWTELGAEQLGILHSLTVTCRLHGINPYHYLVDVLQRVAAHPAKDVIELTPRRWKDAFNHQRMKSDIHT